MSSSILKLSPVTKALTRNSPQTESLGLSNQPTVTICKAKWNDVAEATNLTTWDLS